MFKNFSDYSLKRYDFVKIHFYYINRKFVYCSHYKICGARRRTPDRLFPHILKSICGNGPDGKGLNLLQGPRGGKNAQIIPVLQPRRPSVETIFTPVWGRCEPDFTSGAGRGGGRRVQSSQLYKRYSENFYRCRRSLVKA
jgi:hypothetical protein